MTAQFSSKRQYFNRQIKRVMLPTTLSAGTIVYSAPLANFSVTGRYEVHPGVLKIKMSTQQSTWMKMVMEDGRGGDVGRWWWRGGIGRWCWAVIEDCNGSIGWWQRQKIMQRWHRCRRL
jgi:hypothetical protein